MTETHPGTVEGTRQPPLGGALGKKRAGGPGSPRAAGRRPGADGIEGLGLGRWPGGQGAQWGGEARGQGRGKRGRVSLRATKLEAQEAPRCCEQPGSAEEEWGVDGKRKGHRAWLGVGCGSSVLGPQAGRRLATLCRGPPSPWPAAVPWLASGAAGTHLGLALPRPAPSSGAPTHVKTPAGPAA